MKSIIKVNKVGNVYATLERGLPGGIPVLMLVAGRFGIMNFVPFHTIIKRSK
jgi:hypothetical protein